jgi:hypothetical protein
VSQYDVAQEEYDPNVGSILEQLKQKATKFFGTVQQKTNGAVESWRSKRECWFNYK